METVSTMGTGSLGRELDLDALVAELNEGYGKSVDANFTSGSIVTLRLEEDGAAYTVYRTGTFQVRGANSSEKMRVAADEFVRMLEKFGVSVPEYDFEHSTSVFMEDLGQEVNLSALAVALGMEDTEYEPEQFPGLIYRNGGNTTLLIFSTGKVIVSGTTEKEVARSSLSVLREELAAIG